MPAQRPRHAYGGSAIRILETLTREHPETPDYRLLLALCCRGAESASSPAGSAKGADRRRAIAILEQLTAEYPSVADYRYDQAKNMARQNGLTFFMSLTNGLAQGKTFDALCADAKLQPLPLPAFSISTRSLPEVENQINLNMLKQLAFTTAPGKVSGFQWTAEGGIILYVKAKLPVDETRMKTELPAFIAAVRQQRQQEAFQLWFQQEFSRNVRALLAQPQQQPPPNLSSRAAKKS